MVGIPAATITPTAIATTAAAVNSPWFLIRVHQLPMFGSLGRSEFVVIWFVVPLGFDMGTSVNLLLCWLASVTVTTAAASTTSATSLPGITLSNG